MTDGGLFSWVPTEAHGGSTDNPYPFTIQVTNGKATTQKTIKINATEVHAKSITTELVSCKAMINSTASAVFLVEDEDRPKQTMFISNVITGSSRKVG